MLQSPNKEKLTLLKQDVDIVKTRLLTLLNKMLALLKQDVDIVKTRC